MQKRMTEFQECAACAAQPGSPTLCASCLHNRRALDERWIYAEGLIEEQRVWARSQQRKAFLSGCVIGMMPLAIYIGWRLP